MIDGKQYFDAKYVKESCNFELYQLSKVFEFFEESKNDEALKEFKKNGDKNKYESFLKNEIEKGFTSQENLEFLKKSSRIGLYLFFIIFFFIFNKLFYYFYLFFNELFISLDFIYFYFIILEKINIFKIGLLF